MSVFACILYGFISGITEFLPVSSRGHQALMRYLFGAETRIPLQEFLVHIGVFFALIVSSSEILHKLIREQRLISGNRRRKMGNTDRSDGFDLRLLKTAAVPLFVCLFIYFQTSKFENNLLLVMIFWIVNAIVLLVADFMPRGDRNAKSMSSIDGIVMGLSASLSVLPGISRTGFTCAYAIARGADDDNAAHWAVLLGIPALVFAMFFDLASFVALGIGVRSMVSFLSCILSGVFAFVGGYFGISLFKLLLKHSGLSQFAYYSVGAALFSFAIYLIT